MEVSSSAVAIQAEARRRMLDLRAIDYQIQSAYFQNLWDASTAEEREQLLESINKIDIDTVKNWMDRVLKLRDMSKQKLMQLASYHRIRNYSRISRTQLLRELRKKGVNDSTIKE